MIPAATMMVGAYIIMRAIEMIFGSQSGGRRTRIIMTIGAIGLILFSIAMMIRVESLAI